MIKYAFAVLALPSLSWGNQVFFWFCLFRTGCASFCHLSGAGRGRGGGVKGKKLAVSKK